VKPFGTTLELKPPLTVVSSPLEINPLEYIYEAKTETDTKRVTVTSPLKWVLTYPDTSLGKLRELLSRRGITSTSSALAAALVGGAVVSAPAGLAATITTTVMAPVLATQASGTGGHSIHSETSMKCYLITTATVFGVLAGFHIWRASIEGMRLIREPLFLGLTLAAISLCCWGCCLLVRYSRSR
jgi:hypothetical protein